MRFLPARTKPAPGDRQEVSLSKTNSTREKLLNQWASAIVQHAAAGTLDRGRPIAIHSIEAVAGPRAGALEIHAGLDTGRLLTALSRNDFAMHRQFIPWRFEGQPSVYLTSRYVRLEAGWPGELAQADIPLSKLGQHPRGAGRWIAGMNESGATITIGLDDKTPHYLIAGTTGSGKTYTERAALVQLAAPGKDHFILIDGKYGDGFGCLKNLPGLVGPVALDAQSAKGALAWACTEMKRRYIIPDDPRNRLIIAIDEIQEFTGKAGDPAIVEMTRKLLAQGRGAQIHVILGTQHPTMNAFTDPAIKANITGHIACLVESYEASEAAIGAPQPRADRLMGQGDAYIVTPSASRRAQLAYIPPAELGQFCTAPGPELATWPEFDAEAIDRMPDDAPKWNYSGPEIGAALANAADDGGRPALVKLLDEAGLGRPGVTRAIRLLNLGRDAHAWLVERGWCLSVQDQPTCSEKPYIVTEAGKVVSVQSKWTDRQDENA